jgi:hypothetical protein
MFVVRAVEGMIKGRSRDLDAPLLTLDQDANMPSDGGSDPLLGPTSDSQHALVHDEPILGTDDTSSEQVRLNHATATLAVTMLGAGIMALPRAFAILGIVLGVNLNIAVYALSFFSLGALVRCSNLTGKWTYASLAASQFGAAGSTLLQWSIILNNAGAMTVYLIIIGDILVGVAPEYSGLVTNLVGVHDPGVFYVSRPFVVSTVCSSVCNPLHRTSAYACSLTICKPWCR